jgi:hypothetical protein
MRAKPKEIELDQWAAILNPPFTPDPLEPGEKTVLMLAAETGKSAKICGDLLLKAYRCGQVTRRPVHEHSATHTVFAYKPVKQ